MMTAHQIEKNLAQMALQLILDRPLEEVGSSRIYSVVEPWQKAEVQHHAHVIVTPDAKAFEEAIIAPDTKILYVPADAALTPSLARTILMRNPLGKTIIWEGAQ